MHYKDMLVCVKIFLSFLCSSGTGKKIVLEQKEFEEATQLLALSPSSAYNKLCLGICITSLLFSTLVGL